MSCIFKILIFIIATRALGFSQNLYQFEINKAVAECQKSSATLNITGTQPADTINITWSNGSQNVYSVYDLAEGDYSIDIKINQKPDTVLYFKIDKEPFRVVVANQFTPNDDGYNDVLQIERLSIYPNFEFEVFNKWGQKVHSQKSTYTPWDGKCVGIAVPDGTYYYVMFYDGSNKKCLVKGNINILR